MCFIYLHIPVLKMRGSTTGVTQQEGRELDWLFGVQRLLNKWDTFATLLLIVCLFRQHPATCDPLTSASVLELKEYATATCINYINTYICLFIYSFKFWEKSCAYSPVLVIIFKTFSLFFKVCVSVDSGMLGHVHASGGWRRTQGI